ncbi:MAG: PorV/PorQ family protein [Elusimicrobiota bacterium]
MFLIPHNKKIRTIIIFLLTTKIATAQVFALSAGSTGMNFLKIAQGSRGIAMGEAFTAVADDLGAVYWNPAGLTQIESQQVYCMYNQWFQGIRSQYLSYGAPLYSKKENNENISNHGAIATSIQYLSMDPIQGYDYLGEATSSLNANDVAISVSYAKLLLNNLSAGINMKYLSENLAGFSANSYAVDIGLLLKTLTGFGFGITIKNLGTPIKFIDEKGPLPVITTLGIAYEKEIFNQPLIVSLDTTIPNDNSPYLGLGAEYWVKDIIALRSGYRGGIDIGSGFRAGIGIKANVFQLDYAFAGFGDLGNTHRVGLSMKLGQGNSYARKDALYNKGEKYFSEGQYTKAINTLNKLLEVAPGNLKALELMRKTYTELEKLFDGHKQIIDEKPAPNKTSISQITNLKSIDLENTNKKTIASREKRYKYY